MIERWHQPQERPYTLFGCRACPDLDAANVCWWTIRAGRTNTGTDRSLGCEPLFLQVAPVSWKRHCTMLVIIADVVAISIRHFYCCARLGTVIDYCDSLAPRHSRGGARERRGDPWCNLPAVRP